MRLRLTLALVGIALASIVFVGLGVLSLAQVGARDEAIDQMSEQLSAVAEIDFAEGRGPADLGRLRNAFEFDRLEFVAIGPNGQLAPGRRPNGGGDDSLTKQITLEEDQFEKLEEGEQIFINLGGSVVGIQTIDLDVGRQEFLPAVVAQSRVATVGPGARRWFMISAVAVLVMAGLVAAWLANRFTRPIAAIEEATNSIAAGDLDARVVVKGDDELAHLARSVNTMAGDLGRSRQLEQQFLMSVSHDLRTPLTAIEGYAEALSDGAVDDTVHTGEIIANHASRLDRLVRDLLDLARLQARQFQMEMVPLDPAVTVGRTVAGLRAEAQARGITLTDQTELGSTVLADPDRLGQIVSNLVDNAIKYAESTIDVRLAPFLTESGAHVVRLTVADDGPGISQSDLPRVFERLYVTQQKPKRAEVSSGLGLAIVRELSQAMGGTVSVASEIGLGTTMVVELPTT